MTPRDKKTENKVTVINDKQPHKIVYTKDLKQGTIAFVKRSEFDRYEFPVLIGFSKIVRLTDGDTWPRGAMLVVTRILEPGEKLEIEVL